MNWTGITVRVDWTRCTRRRWPALPQLDFSPQERRKTKNVLLYWWAGRGERRLPSGLVPIHAGLCHWARPGWSYACSQSPRNPLGVTAIHFDLLDARGRIIPPDSAHLPPEPLTVRSPSLVEEVTRWIAERAMDARAGMPNPPELEQAGNNLLRGLLIKLTHDTALASDPMHDTGPLAWRQLTAYVQEHLHNLQGINSLVEKSGYSRSHFSRLFHRQTGLSPRQYLINARLALAKELLRGTSLSISAISERTGYGDVFQFSKQFKRRTGQSPTAYRSAAQ